MATTKTLPDGSVVTLPADTDTADIAVITTDMTNICTNITTLSDKITPGSIGSLASISALSTALDTKLSAMGTYSSQQVRFTMSSAEGAFRASTLYSGTLYKAGTNGNATLVVSTLSGGDGKPDMIYGQKTTTWAFESLLSRNRVFLWNDSSTTLSQFISQCESAMPTNGLYYLGYINWAVAQNYGISINGYVLGYYYSSNFKKIEIHSSSNSDRVQGTKAVISQASGTWATSFVEMPSDNDVYYKVGDSISATFLGYGWVTSSATKVSCFFPLPKVIPEGRTVTLKSGSRFEFRGITGYIGEFTSSNSVEVVGNANYTVSIARNNDGAVLSIDIVLTSGNYGVTNNTPVNVRASTLKFEIS